MLWCMLRTNIYLDERQAAALSERARAEGVSRAELIRRLLDRALGTGEDLEGDLAAIVDSFGVAKSDEFVLERGPDERSAHLDRMWRS